MQVMLLRPFGLKIQRAAVYQRGMGVGLPIQKSKLKSPHLGQVVEPLEQLGQNHLARSFALLQPWTTKRAWGAGEEGSG